MRASPARPRPAVVYGIADVDSLGIDRVVAAVAEMAEAGLGTIQVRAKRVGDDLISSLCEEILSRLAGWPGGLWIDDRVDLAMAYPFAGVHLGQRDVPAASARPQLAERQAIGSSTHDEEQLAEGDSDPAVDWLALGPIFPTASKERPDPVVGLAGLARGRARTGKPLIAIGGIDERNLAEVLAQGADSVAVLSALCRGDVRANCRRLLRAAGAQA